MNYAIDPVGQRRTEVFVKLLGRLIADPPLLVAQALAAARAGCDAATTVELVLALGDRLRAFEEPFSEVRPRPRWRRQAAAYWCTAFVLLDAIGYAQPAAFADELDLLAVERWIEK